jgi:hypothetical protein
MTRLIYFTNLHDFYQVTSVRKDSGCCLPTAGGDAGFWMCGFWVFGIGYWVLDIGVDSCRAKK